MQKSSLAFLIGAVIAVAPIGASADTTPTPVRILAVNDVHGYLAPEENHATINIGQPVNSGGLAYMATLLTQLRAVNPNNIFVAAGDIIGASPFASSIAHDEPTVDIVNQLGLEISAVGNHEFDKGLTELRRIQGNNGTSTCFPDNGTIGSTCLMPGGTFSGAKWQYLAANIIDKATGQSAFPATYIKSFPATDGHSPTTIGFIGVILKNTPSFVASSTIKGLQFNDEAGTINAAAADLKQQGVNAVVVLIHQGGFTTARKYGDNTCQGFTGDLLPVIDRLSTDVDVVVSGHTHTDYICRRNGKLITQSGLYGMGVTSIDLTFDSFGNVASAEAVNNPVINDTNKVPYTDGVVALAKTPSIDAAITRYEELSQQMANTVVGSIAAYVPKGGKSGESPMGDMVADAELAAFPDAQIAFIQAGSVRNSLGTPEGSYPNFPVVYSQAFATTPFHNGLIAIDMTGDQIKRTLEQQWEAPNNTLFVSPGSVGEALMNSNGFTYTWDSSQPAGAASGQGNRVIASSMMLNGVPMEGPTTYRVVVPSYLLGGGDNFTGFTAGKNPVEGIVDVDALIAYLAKNPNYAPVSVNRVTKLGNNP